MSTSETDVLDHAQLDDLRQLGPEFIAELHELWTQTAGDYLETMTRSAERPDVDPLCEASHALRGSSATVGAVALPAACHRIEELARSGAGPDVLRPALEQVRTEFQRLHEELGRITA